MKTLTKSISLLVLAAIFTSTSLSAVETDPVGYVTISVPAESDALVSLPMTRPAAFSGEVDSVSGNVISFSSPVFTPDEFVYEESVQTNTYYLIITSGESVDGQPTSSSLEGAILDVTDNDGSSVTVDLGGQSLANLKTTQADGVGDTVQIVPYWSLNTLLPEGGDLTPSTTFTPQVSILIPDNVGQGINLSSSDTYFYYSGAAAGGEGWRRSGSSPILKFDDVALAPDSYFVIRNTTVSVNSFTVPGNVPLVAFRTPLNTLADNTEQDNFIGLPFPVETTLSQSQLFESGAFVGSPTFTPVDTVLIVDNLETGFNKSSSDTYFYYTGAAAGGPGWRRAGSSPVLKFDDEPVFKIGSGFIIRKGAEATANSDIWAAAPPYTL